MKTKKTNFKKNTVTLFFFSLTFLVISSNIQAQTVLPNVRVNTTDYHEVSVDAAGKRIAVLNDTVYAIWEGWLTDTTSNIYFVKSVDKGLTFSEDLPIFAGPDSILHLIPSIAVAQNGDIYIAWNAASNNESYWNIWFTKSSDGGSTFLTPTHITTSNACMFPCVGAYNNNVYIFYAEGSNFPNMNYHFVRSTNGGISFESPIQVNDESGTGDIEFDKLTSMTIDTSGIIYLAWIDGRRATGQGDVFFAKSTDNGQSFSSNVMVNDINQSGADSVQGSPSIAAEGNNVYVSFVDRREGSGWENARVYMAKSTDGGNTFSTESYLVGHTGTCSFHDVTVSLNGKLSVAICSHIMPTGFGVWLYESTDGGNNFSTPLALSDAFSNNFSAINIISNSDNEILALWKDSREGDDIENIYFAKTDLGVKIDELNFDNESFCIYPNPTNGSFSVSTQNNNTNIEISICNLQGQIIYKKAYSDTSNVNIDLEIPQGVYFVTIKLTDETKTIKLIKN
ncbi:MAG TPA: T9SS type A sorting domain-containing protein [Salinivirgaceae bacterium]|nr:T9SS type A sorting domain-containing protein [Salinivirgaceae bacterium]HQA76602.1 T9SS type A sorting domain-containing protein [Salinivirgaceae bacterium]